MIPSLKMHSSAPSTESENTLHNDHANSGQIEQTPLPWRQLLIVYMIQLAEPVTATVIYPFISQFVRATGITKGDVRKTGYFAGIVQSAFFFAEAMTVVPWGMASDRFGRRPVLLLGPLGLTIVMLGFGMSTTFWPLVFFRCLQGAFNGNIGVTKSVIGEITDATNIADAFALVTVFWTTGITVGPFIGGLLSQPAKRWPDVFGKFEYLQRHPYFLPCFAASLFALFVFMTAGVALKETLLPAVPPKTPKLSLKSSLMSENEAPRYGSTDSNHGNSPAMLERGHMPVYQAESKPPSLCTILKLRDVQITLLNFAFLGFCDMSVQSLTPLMWSTSIELGGLGFSSYMIGMAMGTYGVLNAFLQVAFLGKIIRRFGPRKVHITCFSCFLLSFLSFPVASFFAQCAGRSDWKVWATVIISLAAQSMVSGAYGSLQIIMTGTAPSRSSLGTMNGLGQAVGSISRSLGPSVALSLHSISLQHQLAGGNAVYFIMMVIVSCGIQFTLMLPKKLRI
jgi:MFS family permease